MMAPFREEERMFIQHPSVCHDYGNRGDEWMQQPSYHPPPPLQPPAGHYYDKGDERMRPPPSNYHPPPQRKPIEYYRQHVEAKKGIIKSVKKGLQKKKAGPNAGLYERRDSYDTTRGYETARSNARSNNEDMESFVGVTPEQLRQGGEFHQNRSKMLLNSLLPPNGNALSKKDKDAIASKAYVHSNEGKRLMRKAEVIEARQDEEQRAQHQSSSGWCCTGSNEIIASGEEERAVVSSGQLRQTAYHHEDQSRRLLNSLLPPYGSSLKKKDIDEITSTAYAHSNEARRLRREAEILEEAEKEGDDSSTGRGCCGMWLCMG